MQLYECEFVKTIVEVVDLRREEKNNEHYYKVIAGRWLIYDVEDSSVLLTQSP